MKIYCGGRANGKTIKAIQLSAEKQIPIVCFSYHQIEYIKYGAKEMNLKIPEPVTVEDVRKKVIGNRRGLIVDDLDLLLRRIFDDEVRYATIGVCDIEKLERSDTYYPYPRKKCESQKGCRCFEKEDGIIGSEVKNA